MATLTHGLSRTSVHCAYFSARYRCNNPKAEKYPQYGGRGIKFLFKSFEEFYNELGPKPSAEHSLDRIDNDGHYEKGNVRWATVEQQMASRRLSGAALESHKARAATPTRF